MNSSIRKSNFELLRIVSMLMIVLTHIIIHGNVIYNCRNNNLFFILEIILFLTDVHVNLYVLLSGYFQVNSKFKLSKIIRLICEVIFYNVLILVILVCFGIVAVDKVEVYNYLLLLNKNSLQYWFIKTYIFLYVISPFLNQYIKQIDKKTYQKLLLVLFFLLCVIPILTANKFFDNDGFTLYNFIFLYFVGSYIRLYPVKDSYLFKKMTKNLYVLILISIFLFVTLINYCLYKTSSVLINYNNLFNEIFSGFMSISRQYSSPFVIIQAISLFLLFQTFSIKSKFINKISNLMLGVYMIHDNHYLRQFIYKWLKIDNGPIYSFRFIIYVFLMMLFIFAICSLIEYFRSKLFNLIEKRRVFIRLKLKLNSYISNIGIIDVNCD